MSGQYRQRDAMAVVEHIRDVTVSVGTSNTLVSQQVNQGQRRVLVITNTSTAGQLISLAWGSEAVANEGVVLYPGGTWQESVDGYFVPSNLYINAISSAASGSIAVHERVL